MAAAEVLPEGVAGVLDSASLLLALLVVGGTSALWVWLRRMEASSPEAPPVPIWPEDGVFTMESLARFDGVGQPLCLGICGKVVNCAASENIRPGEGYGKLWAGRDGTYAFALCSLKPEHANKMDWKLEDFTPEEFKALASWYKHFTTKYPVVGTLKEYDGWDFSSVVEASVHETPFASSQAASEPEAAKPEASQSEEAAGAKAEAAPEVLRPGDPVRLQGLQARADLNGRVGELRTFVAEKKRFAVAIEGEAEPLLLKPENIKKVAAAEATQ